MSVDTALWTGMALYAATLVAVMLVAAHRSGVPPVQRLLSSAMLVGLRSLDDRAPWSATMGLCVSVVSEGDKDRLSSAMAYPWTQGEEVLWRPRFHEHGRNRACTG